VKELDRSRFINRSVSHPFARVIVEKPIGRDLESARAINDAIAEVFAESQIYRIDHYLGKETVQNILVLRFANSIFEPLFNARHVDHVQITVAEEEGVGTRAGYYDQAGALRDMVQNHLLQLLALVAMESPRSLHADVIRDQKLDVLLSLRPITGDSVATTVVRAQYVDGFDLGAPVRGYLAEQGVAQDSRTETFVALKVFVDNWRWAGVPFFIRTGKRLPKRASEISVHLKRVPPILFNADPSAPLDANVLSIRIQPDEGFALAISSKIPGPRGSVYPVQMDFHYGSTFGGSDAGGVRAAAARRDGGRADAVHAARRGRGGMAMGHAHPRLLVQGDRRSPAHLRRGRVGTSGSGAPDRIDGTTMAAPLTERIWRTSAPATIERDLAELWRDVGAKGPVARAIMSNLVIVRAARVERRAGVSIDAGRRAASVAGADHRSRATRFRSVRDHRRARRRRHLRTARSALRRRAGGGPAPPVPTSRCRR
jgi:hypothetical protein